ncbi:MAG TPA: hypothetical protein VGY66_26705 [Gemmataceae bacterium]|nr:hypothetical protein [Gemmataceae bacterium]
MLKVPPQFGLPQSAQSMLGFHGQEDVDEDVDSSFTQRSHSVDRPENDDAATIRKVVFVAAIGALLYGGYCLVQSPLVQQETARVPKMTCNQLIQNGAANQRYVTLTDACLSSRRSVAEQDSDTGALEMYHPLYDANLVQEPAPRDLNLILCIMDEMDRRRIRDDRKQRQQLGQPGLSELTGEVTQGAAQLPPWAREGLRDQFPGIALGQCWVLTVGRYEPTMMRAERLRWHGLLSASAGGVLLLGWLVWRRAGRPNQFLSPDGAPRSCH